MPSSCFDDPNHQGQVTVGNGYYKFDINFSDPACSSSVPYQVRVDVPGTGYVPGVSELIPPTSDESTAPFNVPACAGSITDAVPATAQYCEAQPSEFAPPPAIQARTAGTELSLAADARWQPVARFVATLQQPHSARPASERRRRSNQDDAAPEHQSRSARSVRDYGPQFVWR